MNYLFFDIECSNSYVESSKVCSFGYVLTDEKFNIVQEEDIFINPSGRFKLTGRKRQVDIELKYPEEFFRQQKKFPDYYYKIKNLLENSDTTVIGYSTDNDVRYILTELLYYELPPINFKYYDIQQIFDLEFSFNRRISLSNASELLNLRKQDDKHDSLSDAKSTMNICKHVCDELKINIDELLKKHNTDEFKDYRLTADKDEQIQVLSSFKLTKYYIKQEAEPIEFVNNKKFCFSRKLEEEQMVRATNLFKIVTDGGGVYCTMVMGCDIFITDDVIDEEDSRYKFALKKKEKDGIIIIKYSDFISKIGVTNEELDNINPVENMVKKYEPNEWVENQILLVKEKNENKATMSLGDMFQDFFNDLKKNK